MVVPAKEEGAWFRQRGYPHFDVPRSFESASDLVGNPIRVARHAFRPFLMFEKTQRRFKKDSAGIRKKKTREIMYACHSDSYIYSYYAHLLNERYERILASCDFEPAVIAYRQLGRSNIHFAKAAFDRIQKVGDCTVIALDVKKFFDSLEHKLLKNHWKKVLRVDELPADHFAVFNRRFPRRAASAAA